MKKCFLLATAMLSVISAMFVTMPARSDSGNSEPSFVSSDAYTLQPDDVVVVNVVGFADLNEPQTVVLPDGTITVPLVGSVSVVGKTTAQVEKDLTKRYSKYVIDPNVTVSLTVKHKELISFSGWVTHPGPIDYRPNYHILDALAEAGGALTPSVGPNGIAEPGGDLSKVTVTDLAGNKQVLDLSHPETKAGTDVDILLNVGDVVYVPEQRAEFSVVGEVLHPGSYPYLENQTVLDLLTTSGGVLPDADLSDATLYHNGKDSPIDLDALLRRGDLSQNIILAAGDRLTVPEGNRTYVYGAVSKPGYYTFKPGDRILDALDAAGGPQAYYGGGPQPDLAKVHLIRKENVDGVATAEIQIVDLQQFLNKGVEQDNAPINPGDVLYVPTKGHKFSFNDVAGPLGGVEDLAYVHSLTK